MKILYLITKSEAGGAQTHVADLCRYFKEQGNEIMVMSGGNGWLKNECDKIGAMYVDNKFFSNSPSPWRLYQAILMIKQYAEKFKPDIVHCHSSSAGILGRLAIKGKIRTIYTAHGWGFNIGMKSWVKYPVLFLEKICAKYTETYICVAEFVKKLGLKYNLAPMGKFVTIYNGVEIQSLEQNEKRSAEKINLIFVGRLAEPKKPELIISALMTLPDELKQKIKFTIIGDGPKKTIVERQAKICGVEIDFSGALTKDLVLTELKKADIFVYVSAWEGLPYTILEAMSVGLPVIASDVGGIAEMVTVDNGILVNNEVGQIQSAVLKLISDEKLRIQLGEVGRNKVITKYSVQEMLKKVEKIYFTEKNKMA